jgi:hypothetical protein
VGETHSTSPRYFEGKSFWLYVRILEQTAFVRHASDVIGHNGSEGSPQRGPARDIDGAHKRVRYGPYGSEQLETHSSPLNCGMIWKQAAS